MLQALTKNIISQRISTQDRQATNSERAVPHISVDSIILGFIFLK